MQTEGRADPRAGEDKLLGKEARSALPAEDSSLRAGESGPVPYTNLVGTNSHDIESRALAISYLCEAAITCSTKATKIR